MVAEALAKVGRQPWWASGPELGGDGQCSSRSFLQMDGYPNGAIFSPVKSPFLSCVDLFPKSSSYPAVVMPRYHTEHY